MKGREILDKVGHIRNIITIPNFIFSLVFLFVITIIYKMFLSPFYYFSIIPAFAIIVLLIFWSKLQVLFFMIMFFLPFDSFLEIVKTGYGLTVNKLLALLLIIMLLFIFIFRIKNKIVFNLKSKLWVWFLLFTIFNFISALLSDYPGPSFNHLRKTLVVIIIFAFILIFLDKKKFEKTLPRVIVASISMNSFFVILGYLFNIKIFVLDSSGSYMKRGTGLVDDPNGFAAMVCFILPIIFYWYFKENNKQNKIPIVLVILLNVIAVVFTFSRGGFLLLLITLMLIFLNYRDKFRPIYTGFIITGILAALLSLAVIIPDSYWVRQKSLMYGDMDSSITRRFSYLQSGFSDFIKKPVLGHGPGTFSNLYEKSKFNLTGDARSPHNAYIAILIGSGLVGFLIFSIIIVLAYRDFSSSGEKFLKRGKTEMFSLNNAYKLSFIVMLISFLTSSNPNTKYFWISLGLSQVSLFLSNKEEK